MKHKVIRKRIVRADEVFEPGDIFEPKDHELEHFGDNLEKVEDEITETIGHVETKDKEICGTEMSDGSICERPVDECIYHENE